MPRRKLAKAKLKDSENEDPDKSIVADSNDDAALRKEAFMKDFRIQGLCFILYCTEKPISSSQCFSFDFLLLVFDNCPQIIELLAFFESKLRV